MPAESAPRGPGSVLRRDPGITVKSVSPMHLRDRLGPSDGTPGCSPSKPLRAQEGKRGETLNPRPLPGRERIGFLGVRRSAAYKTDTEKGRGHHRGMPLIGSLERGKQVVFEKRILRRRGGGVGRREAPRTRWPLASRGDGPLNQTGRLGLALNVRSRTGLEALPRARGAGRWCDSKCNRCPRRPSLGGRRVPFGQWFIARCVSVRAGGGRLPPTESGRTQGRALARSGPPIPLRPALLPPDVARTPSGRRVALEPRPHLGRHLYRTIANALRARPPRVDSGSPSA